MESDLSKIVSLLELLERFFPSIMRRGKGLLKVDSTIPRGMGFGSSAALCVAFVMAGLSVLSGRLRYPFRRNLWQLSNRAEKLFHGTPSGIDTGLSLLGGMQAFVKPGERVLLKVNAAFASPPALGATSHPDLVAAVVRLCLDAGAARVIVTDNPINDPASCFDSVAVPDWSGGQEPKDAP